MEINLNKFQKESIEQKQYSPPDSGLTHIHISTGFSEECSNEIIIHLSSILKQMSSSIKTNVFFIIYSFAFNEYG